MAPDQIRIHLELHGWEAWLERVAPGVYVSNLTHRRLGTLWARDGSAGYHNCYRYGLNGKGDVRVNMADIPDSDLHPMWTKIQEVCHGP